MQVRPAGKEEFSRVFRLSYDVSSGISVTRHIVNCKRSWKLRSGRHFVLEDDDGRFLATITAYRFGFPGIGTTIGLANLFVPPVDRERGLGRRLLQGVLDEYEQQSLLWFYLLSAIGTDFYQKFGFRELPVRYEAAPECVPMLRCPAEDWQRLSGHGPYLRGLMAFID